MGEKQGKNRKIMKNLGNNQRIPFGKALGVRVVVHLPKVHQGVLKPF